MELLKKLRLDTAKPLLLINAPAECKGYFSDFMVKEKAGKDKPVAQLLLFAVNGADLEHYLPRLADHIGHDTLLWICYPKKTGAIRSDLVLMKTWDIVFNSGYRGQTSVSIDDNWTGMRFTSAPRTRASDCDVPMEERQHEGIDYVKRTVKLPADAQKAVDKYKGLSDFFYNMAFTHKKEHVLAIIDAKKPETRLRRIEKMTEMLQQQMHTKAVKKKTGTK